VFMIKVEKVERSLEGKVLLVRVLVDGYKEFVFMTEHGRIVQISSSPIKKELWIKMFKRVVAIFHSRKSTSSHFHHSRFSKKGGRDQQISLNF